MPNARRDEGAYLAKYVTEEQQRSRRKDGLPRRGWPILAWLVAYPRLRTIQVRRTAVRLEPSQNRLSQCVYIIVSQALRIPNKLGSRPSTFEIDCLVGKEAFEIKWRDATTDGDHITKEHTRVKNIKNAGYKPIRIMFYYPNRKQAIRIQETLKTIYAGVGGKYYFGKGAWEIIKKKTGVNLLGILEKIAASRTKGQ